MNHRYQQAVIDGNHQANMARPLAGTMRASADSGSPENMEFNAGNSISDQRDDRLQAENHSRTISVHRPKVSRRIHGARRAFPSSRPSGRPLNWGIVALLKVMARANARRIGESGLRRGCGGARWIDGSPHIVQLNAASRSRAHYCSKIHAAFGGKFAGRRECFGYVLRRAAKSRPVEGRRRGRPGLRRAWRRPLCAGDPAVSADSIPGDLIPDRPPGCRPAPGICVSRPVATASISTTDFSVSTFKQQLPPAGHVRRLRSLSQRSDLD